MDYTIKNSAVFGTDIPISMFRIFQKISTASICKQSMVELGRNCEKKRVNSFYQIVVILYITKGIIKYIRILPGDF